MIVLTDIFLESIRLGIETNVIKVFYSGITYLVHASSYSDPKQVCLFLFSFVISKLSYFLFVTIHSCDNYPSRFFLHPIQIVRLYDVMKSSWQGTLRHDTMW